MTRVKFIEMMRDEGVDPEQHLDLLWSSWVRYVRSEFMLRTVLGVYRNTLADLKERP